MVQYFQLVKVNLVKPTLKVIFFLLLVGSSGWGFFGHQTINRLAVFTLPPEMIGFYKAHIDYITTASVNPDRRRYAVKDEAPRHYIDLEDFGDSALTKLPKYWRDAVKKFTEDSLNAHGIVPWHIVRVQQQLKEAFVVHDPEKILRCSAELGHYISDANVPLHTTRNHNGQFTGQHGIHGFWESRLPELFSGRYNFFTGKASYESDPQARAWEAVRIAHLALDSVLKEERQLTTSHGTSKYNYETKGKQTVRVYSLSFSRLYHDRLNGMVERQLRASMKMTGDLWYTAWVDAGQPDLRLLIHHRPTEGELKARREELEKWKEQTFKSREHENDH